MWYLVVLKYLNRVTYISCNIFIVSEASDLLFKTIIFNVTPNGSQVFTQGFSELSAGGGGEHKIWVKCYYFNHFNPILP